MPRGRPPSNPYSWQSWLRAELNYEELVPTPENLDELNEINYKHFCDLAKDPFWRSAVFSNSGGKHVGRGYLSA